MKMRAVGEPPLFFIKHGLEAPSQKFLKDKHVLQNLKFLLLCRYSWHRSENRQEAGMKKKSEVAFRHSYQRIIDHFCISGSSRIGKVESFLGTLFVEFL